MINSINKLFLFKKCFWRIDCYFDLKIKILNLRNIYFEYFNFKDNYKFTFGKGSMFLACQTRPFLLH
jgi:hypothetical protein